MPGAIHYFDYTIAMKFQGWHMVEADYGRIFENLDDLDPYSWVGTSFVFTMVYCMLAIWSERLAKGPYQKNSEAQTCDT